MMNAAVGSSENVTGSRSATAIDEPRPGITPTAVPRRQPISTHMRLYQVRAPAKPSPSICSASMSGPPTQDAGRQGHAERHVERDVGERAHREADDRPGDALPGAEAARHAPVEQAG